MGLFEFARGPALQWALVIFLLGVTWRLFAALSLAHRGDYSVPRTANSWRGGARTIFLRMWPKREFFAPTAFQLLMGYTFHIGLAITVFGFIPHIEFIRGLTGLSWPGLPNDLVIRVGGVTVFALGVMLIRRIGHPVLRFISDWDDYFSWALTITPLLTGIMAYAHFGPRYETMLGIHVLSFDLLLIWFPFGKLMHAFLFVPSRAIEGKAFERKGVRA
jgi:nitrate reductase gamma subunit